MRTEVLYLLGTDADYGSSGRIFLNLIRGLDAARFEPVVMASARGQISEEMS